MCLGRIALDGSDYVGRSNLQLTISKSINPFPALIKSKYLLNFDYFCSIFISRRWSAVSLNHSIPPESMMNQLRDGGGLCCLATFPYITTSH